MRCVDSFVRLWLRVRRPSVVLWLWPGHYALRLSSFPAYVARSALREAFVSMCFHAAGMCSITSRLSPPSSRSPSSRSMNMVEFDACRFSSSVSSSPMKTNKLGVSRVVKKTTDSCLHISHGRLRLVWPSSTIFGEGLTWTLGELWAVARMTAEIRHGPWGYVQHNIHSKLAVDTKRERMHQWKETSHL